MKLAAVEPGNGLTEAFMIPPLGIQPGAPLPIDDNVMVSTPFSLSVAGQLFSHFRRGELSLLF